MPNLLHRFRVAVPNSQRPLVARRFATLLLVGVSLWGVPLLTQPLAALAQERPVRAPRTLTVTGVGRENIPTTLTQVTLGVEAQGKTAQVVQQEIARRTSAVVALLRSRNVERLETTGINLSPDYSYANNRQQLIGYRGSNTVSFRIPTERAGNLLDEAVQAGASNINGVSFVASDSAIAEARQRALKAATLDAQNQAKAVLAALNLQPGGITSIVINNTNAPEPRPVAFRMRAQGADAAPSTPVMGGEQQVEASVTLEIGY